MFIYKPTDPKVKEDLRYVDLSVRIYLDKLRVQLGYDVDSKDWQYILRRVHEWDPRYMTINNNNNITGDNNTVGNNNTVKNTVTKSSSSPLATVWKWLQQLFSWLAGR